MVKKKLNEEKKKNFTLLFNLRERIRASKQGDTLKGPMTGGELAAFDEAIATYYKLLVGHLIPIEEGKETDVDKALEQLKEAEAEEKKTHKKKAKKKK